MLTARSSISLPPRLQLASSHDLRAMNDARMDHFVDTRATADLTSVWLELNP